MTAIKIAKSKSFNIFGSWYVFDFDFSKEQIEELKKQGWTEVRSIFLVSPGGWSPKDQPEE